MPTVKQQRAVKKTLENLRSDNPKTEAQILKESGYSDNICSQPTQVKNSKGWQMLMDKYLPDDLLTKVHKEGLEAKIRNKPDFNVRHKYLDTAYKIKKKYEDSEQGNVLNNVNLVWIENLQLTTNTSQEVGQSNST